MLMRVSIVVKNSYDIRTCGTKFDDVGIHMEMGDAQDADARHY